ncbi:MAG: MinD/ParA family protein [Syntrophomonadales bacterium]|jgi:flagellar biosynthesis protein FlhG
MKDQADRLRTMAQSIKAKIESDMLKDIKHTRIIVVTSGKGGVGKTNLALNLAISLGELEKKVILFDADMGLANVDIILGMVPKYNLYHVIRQEKELRDIIISGPKGVQIIPGGSGIFQMANLSENQLREVVSELGTLDGEFEVMIIDTGAGIANNVLSFALMADDLIVLTTPEPTSLTDAYGIIKTTATREARGQYHLVVNRASSEAQGTMVGQKLRSVCEKFLGVKVNVLGSVSEDRSVYVAVMKQEALVLHAPNSAAAQDIRGIACRLCESSRTETAQPIGIKGFFRSITNLWKQ